MARTLPALTSCGMRRQRLLERRRGVVAMRLVEVDVVGLQPLQRVLDGAHDVGPAARPLLIRRHLHAALGGDDHLRAVAAGLEPVADDGLALAAAVAGLPSRIDVGGVDAVEAGADKGVEQRERGLLVRRPAEHVAAEDERRDLQSASAELALLHEGHFQGGPSGLACWRKLRSGAGGGKRMSARATCGRRRWPSRRSPRATGSYAGAGATPGRSARASLPTGRSRALLAAERIDRIEVGGAARREEAEE